MSHNIEEIQQRHIPEDVRRRLFAMMSRDGDVISVLDVKGDDEHCEAQWPTIADGDLILEVAVFDDEIPMAYPAIRRRI